MRFDKEHNSVTKKIQQLILTELLICEIKTKFFIIIDFVLPDITHCVFYLTIDLIS